MNDRLAMALGAFLVAFGVLAELNLLRIFIGDWLEARRERRGRSFPEVRARSIRFRRAERLPPRLFPIAAVIALALTPSIAFAQQAAPSAATLPEVTAPPHDDAPAIPSEPAPLVISADRPGFSETTSIVPAGHLQIETGYTFTFRNRDGVETDRNNAPEILARFGLINDRLEVRLSTAGYVWSRTDDGSGAGFVSSEGFSDLALGLKLKLADQDGWVPRLAFDFTTTLGVGSDTISNQIAEPALKLLWSYDLGQSFGDAWKGVTLGGNAVVAWPTSDGDRFTQGQGSVYLSFPICERTSGFVEYFVIGPNTKGADAAHYVDFGGAYLLNDRVQLDARVGFGLNEEADNAFVGVGISFLF